jgi:subtilase family serine protease
MPAYCGAMSVRAATSFAMLLSASLAAGCSSPSPAATAAADDQALVSPAHHPTRPACASGDGPFHHRCYALVRTDVATGLTPDFTESTAITPDVAYGPKNLRSAYAIPDGGDGVTVGIVDAHDDPNAEADLAVYRAKYGLPACTTANGCFKKVDVNGGTSYPTADYGWAEEIALDLETVSAVCPKCKIVLVEADSTGGVTDDPLAIAIDTAVAQGAQFISNSWGTSESTDPKEGMVEADVMANATHFHHPGVAIFAAAGDSGFSSSPNNSGDGKGASYPADIPEVFSVGGTALTKSSNARGWSESVWGPGGVDGATNSGCSSFFPKPSYQTDTACKGRLDNDLAGAADPDTGMYIYNTYTEFPSDGGWTVIGGTSFASPLVTAIFAASGLVGVDPSYPYAHAADFYDVTSGSDGTCKSQILCHAEKGFDGPTGLGTPNGALLVPAATR